MRKLKRQHHVYSEVQASRLHRRVAWWLKDHLMTLAAILLQAGIVFVAVAVLGPHSIVALLIYVCVIALAAEAGMGFFFLPLPDHRSLAPLTTNQWRDLKAKCDRYPEVRAQVLIALDSGKVLRYRDYWYFQRVALQRVREIRDRKVATKRIDKQKIDALKQAEVEQIKQSLLLSREVQKADQ